MTILLAHIVGFIAIVGLLVLGIALHVAWAKNVMRSGSKLCAALLGRGGFNTLSAECGWPHASAHLRALGGVIDAIFGKGHCTDAARKEGLA